MNAAVQKLLATWGSDVTVVYPDGTRRTVRAVFVPSHSVSWQNMRRVVRDHGQIPTGQMFYAGPADVDLTDADRLEFDGGSYLPRRWERVLLAGEALYGWGLASPLGEEPCENLLTP